MTNCTVWAESGMEVSFWDDQANNIYTFTKPNPRTAYVPPAPQAPPVPPRFAVYETESNKIAVCIAAVGLAIGGFIIWGGLSKAVLAGVSPARGVSSLPGTTTSKGILRRSSNSRR